MLRNDLTKFIQENLLGGDATPIGEEESLIDRGLIDSLGLIRIMTFVETRTGVRIPDHFIIPDNFQTVAAIERTVESVRRSTQLT